MDPNCIYLPTISDCLLYSVTILSSEILEKKCPLKTVYFEVIVLVWQFGMCKMLFMPLKQNVAMK